MTETIILSVAGLVAGSLVTWYFARRYYLMASRERPEWADALAEEVVTKYAALHPDQDPGDLVEIFETALRTHAAGADTRHFRGTIS